LGSFPRHWIQACIPLTDSPTEVIPINRITGNKLSRNESLGKEVTERLTAVISLNVNQMPISIQEIARFDLITISGPDVYFV
jgi:hypothetical protein